MFHYRKLVGTLFGLSILGVCAGYAIRYPAKVGICRDSERICIDRFPIFDVGEPLYWSMLSLSIVFFLLLFVQKEVLKTWAKFAIPFVVVASGILLSTDVYENFSPGRELMSQYLGALYVVLSLVIIFGKYVVLKFRASEV